MDELSTSRIESDRRSKHASENGAEQALFRDAYRDVSSLQNNSDRRATMPEQTTSSLFAREHSATRGVIDVGNIWSQVGIDFSAERRNAGRRESGGATQVGDRVQPCQQPREAGDVARDRTVIRDPRTDRQIEIRIFSDSQGRPSGIQHGEDRWSSRDGGATWTTDDGTYRVLRGTPSIIGAGNYVFRNSDYGVTTTRRPDGSTTREMTIRGGRYGVTEDARGRVVSFFDPTGHFMRRSDGVWQNAAEREQFRHGNVSLNEYGSFRFQSDRGTTEARSGQLDAIMTERAAIERDFRVRFVEPGQRHRGNQNRVTEMPTLEELRTVRDSLNAYRINNDPNQILENRTNMRIFFIRGSSQLRDDTWGEMWRGGERQASHQCGSGGCHPVGPNRSDNGELVLLPRARQETRGFRALEGTLLHELDHHRQGQRAGHTESNVEAARIWGRDPEMIALARRHGWEFDGEHQRFLFRDRAGGLWSPVNEEGTDFRLVSGAGLIGATRSREDLRNMAAVLPATNYFPFPWEAESEAMAMYLMPVREQRNVPNNSDRRTLAETSPQVYMAARDADLRTINRPFLQNVDRLPLQSMRYIRDVNREIVLNTPENWARIHGLEQQWLAVGESRERERLNRGRLRMRF